MWGEDQERRLIEALEREQRTREEIRINKRAREEARKLEGRRVPDTVRVEQWFIDNPGVVIRPRSAKDYLDIEGNVISGFPRVKYDSFRKSILPKLKRKGIIRYYWDPLRCCDVPGWYEYNDCRDLFNEANIPDVGFHGVKIQIRDPRRKTSRGKERYLGSDEMVRILEQNPFVSLREISNKQLHTITLKGNWKSRDLEFNVHIGEADLLEIWIGCSRNPLSIQDFLDLEIDLHQILGGVWVDSSPELVQIGINRDHQQRRMIGLKNYQLSIAKDLLLQIYQKGENVRSEAHIVGPFDMSAVRRGLESGFEDQDNYRTRLSIESLSSKVENLSRLNEILEQRLSEQGENLLSQSVHIGRVADNVGSLLDLLGRKISPDHVTVADPPDEEDFRSYG